MYECNKFLYRVFLIPLDFCFVFYSCSFNFSNHSLAYENPLIVSHMSITIRNSSISISSPLSQGTATIDQNNMTSSLSNKHLVNLVLNLEVSVESCCSWFCTSSSIETLTWFNPPRSTSLIQLSDSWSSVSNCSLSSKQTLISRVRGHCNFFTYC